MHERKGITKPCEVEDQTIFYSVARKHRKGFLSLLPLTEGSEWICFSAALTEFVCAIIQKWHNYGWLGSGVENSLHSDWPFHHMETAKVDANSVARREDFRSEGTL